LPLSYDSSVDHDGPRSNRGPSDSGAVAMATVGRSTAAHSGATSLDQPVVVWAVVTSLALSPQPQPLHQPNGRLRACGGLSGEGFLLF
jgi:hypothetical protein